MAFPAPRAAHVWKAGRFELALGGRTLVAGILNCTPDSFSDGGAFFSPAEALRRFEEMAEEGADLIDVGGESTRPGAAMVETEEEWRRIAPVMALAKASALPVSVDTRKAEIARRALELGAAIVNDVSALRHDPAMHGLLRGSDAGVVLMHMKGEPATMQDAPRYGDVVSEAAAFLRDAASRAEAMGIARERVVIDPGIGFGKTAGQSFELLRRTPELAALGYPVLIGASRKRFLGNLLDLPVGERLEPSLAAHVAAALGGAHIVRAHDVAATLRAVRVADAIRDGDISTGSREDDRAERLRRTREVS